jgi:hypothetical protein
MIPVESRLREELRTCAVELRQLAYTLQNGIGEHDLLRLSERMRATAEFNFLLCQVIWEPIRRQATVSGSTRRPRSS